MKAYQDKTTGKWKWGTRGKPLYDSKQECERAAMDLLVNKLRYIKDKLNGVMVNHGK